MNDTKIEPWTEADTDRAEQDFENYGAIMSPEGYRIIAEVKRQAAEIERLTVALRHAVDVARDIGAQRDRAFDAANRATDLRPGLTEEEARSSRAHAARQAAYHACIGDEPARVDAGWRAFEKALGAPGDVSISRAILERLTKAAESDPDAREARWAAERILQRATLAAEPTRTDPLYARVFAEATQTDATRGAK